ncbi:MAG TPA: hypothetical protein PKC43_05985 [Phycisphaerales bacterium]|nr:hypothetical protein [Phycisphaerales bacterium]HMP36982.1 hypothetical protein [Phycisphaerales bacterium]
MLRALVITASIVIPAGPLLGQTGLSMPTGGGSTPRWSAARPKAIPRTGAVPLCYDPTAVVDLAQHEARAEARGYERQLRDLARRSFGRVRGSLRARGLDEIGEFTDPAAFRPMIRVLKDEAADVQQAMLRLFDRSGAEGQAALAFYAIVQGEASRRGFREEAIRMLLAKEPPIAEEVLRDLDAGLRSTTHAVANGAAIVAARLGAIQTIPLLIFAQATADPVPPSGDLAWIVIGSQTTYVANLIPVVGGSAGAFQPVLGVVNEGSLLRVMDAVAVTYRIDVHNALVSMTSAEWGRPTGSMGYNMKEWYDWYNQTLVPFLDERDRIARMIDEVAAETPAEESGAGAPPRP